MIHAIIQYQTNQNYTSLNTLWTFLILTPLLTIIFSYSVHLLPALYYNFFIYLQDNLNQYNSEHLKKNWFLDHINMSQRDYNRKITWNRTINYYNILLRQLLHILSINRILHDVTCGGFQKGWIKNTILIIGETNINIWTDFSSTTPTLFVWTKVAHMIEDILLFILIIFGSLNKKVRGFQYKTLNRNELKFLLLLLYLLCFWCSHICARTRRYWTSLILFSKL